MTKASDNAFPSLLITEGTEPSAPAAGKQRLYIDSTTHLLKATNSSGTDRTIEAGTAVGNVWTMNKSSSQTLTSNTITAITFDTTVIDGGSSVIDLANDRFVAPATGFFLVFATWIWETTVPVNTAHMSVLVNGTAAVALSRLQIGTAGANGGQTLAGSLSLTSGQFVTLWIHPGGSVTPTARGTAAVSTATTFTLVRIT